MGQCVSSNLCHGTSIRWEDALGVVFPCTLSVVFFVLKISSLPILVVRARTQSCVVAVALLSVDSVFVFFSFALFGSRVTANGLVGGRASRNFPADGRGGGAECAGGTVTLLSQPSSLSCH